MSAHGRAVVMLAVIAVSMQMSGAGVVSRPVLASAQSPLEQRAQVVVPN